MALHKYIILNFREDGSSKSWVTVLRWLMEFRTIMSRVTLSVFILEIFSFGYSWGRVVERCGELTKIGEFGLLPKDCWLISVRKFLEND